MTHTPRPQRQATIPHLRAQIPISAWPRFFSPTTTLYPQHSTTRQSQGWLPPDLSSSPFILSNGKIARFSLPVNSPLQKNSTSEHLLADPLNSRQASRNTFSSLQNTATTFDSTSFTTATSQQQWLSPAPSAPRHSPQTTFSNQPDFVLFEQAPAASLASHPSPATNQGHTFNNVHQQFSTPSPSTYHHRNNSVQRPPVPLFSSNSAPNVPQQSATMFTGSLHSNPTCFRRSLTHSSDMNNSSTAGLDGWAAGFGDQSVTDGSITAHISNFTSINGNNNDLTHSMSAGGTISPKDLMNESVPNSTAMTNLTSPSPWETPLDDYETSPLFELQGDPTLGGPDDWFPLFPDQDPDNNNDDAIQRSISQRSFDSNASASPIVLHPGGQSNRKMSTMSTATATASPGARHHSTAGVQKKNRDLPPILADPSDPIAVKRARNTAAARKSRDRKVKKFEEMGSHIGQLEHALSMKNAEIAKLEAEKEEWKRRALARGS